LMAMRLKVLSPVIARFDQLDARLDASDERLAALARRVDDVETLVLGTGARISTLSEQSLGAAESEARILRRVEAIEGLLGSPSGDR
jgi:uncharacterized protein